jgi:hypothetical protein
MFQERKISVTKTGTENCTEKDHRATFKFVPVTQHIFTLHKEVERGQNEG